MGHRPGWLGSCDSWAGLLLAGQSPTSGIAVALCCDLAMLPYMVELMGVCF